MLISIGICYVVLRMKFIDCFDGNPLTDTTSARDTIQVLGGDEAFVPPGGRRKIWHKESQK